MSALHRILPAASAAAAALSLLWHLPAWAQPGRSGGSGVVIGNVQAVDPADGRLLVATTVRGRAPQAVTLSGDTAIVREQRVKLSELRVGEMVTVTGVPLQIDAREIQSGIEAPPGAATAPAPPSATGASRPRPTAAPSAACRVQGKIARLEPLTLSFPGGLNVEVRTSDLTRVLREVRSTLAEVKAGEPVMVFGSFGTDGAMQARRIQVGLEGFPFAPMRNGGPARPVSPRGGTARPSR